MSDPTDMSWWFGGPTPQNTQYQDRDTILNMISQGFGKNGIVHQQAPQMAAAQAGPAAQAQGAQMGAAQMNMGADPFRAGQLQQIGQLQGIASGQQQGAGELAAQRQIQQALAAQQAQARMARGSAAGLAYRRAADQSAALGSTGAGMGQQAALQDQANAQAALTGALGQGRGMDINVAGQNAGFQQQAGLTNAQLLQNANQYNASNQQQTGLANAGFQQAANQANAGFQQQGQQLNSQNYLQLLQQLTGMDANQLAAQAAAGQNKGMLGPLLSAGGQVGAAAMMASDERLKTDVSDADREIDEMLDKLSPKAGRYKDEKYGIGEWNWVMAQDLERSKAGARVVHDTPEGKMLDVNKALSTALASTARLNARLRAVEAR